MKQLPTPLTKPVVGLILPAHSMADWTVASLLKMVRTKPTRRRCGELCRQKAAPLLPTLGQEPPSAITTEQPPCSRVHLGAAGPLRRRMTTVFAKTRGAYAAAVVATMFQWPGAAATQCWPEVARGAVSARAVEQTAGPHTFMYALLFFGLLGLVASCSCWCGCYMARRPRHKDLQDPDKQESKEKRPRAEKETQTNPIVVRRYWDEPRDMVISLAIRRGIPGACRPRAHLHARPVLTTLHSRAEFLKANDGLADTIIATMGSS